MNMKKELILMSAIAVIACIAFSCKQSVSNQANTAISNDSLIKRGEYLVTITGCGDCHSPKIMTNFGPMPDTTRLFSGHRENLTVGPMSEDAFGKGWVLFNHENTALATPGFVSFSANITSDKTGIGNWSFEQFKLAMTKGKSKGLEGGRDLMPPMPWPNYVNMSEDDLKAIFAFLKSTKPIKNIVPNPVLAKN